jgi:hypothetical protein
MGMFDTLVIDPPLKCDRCGALISETQTKVFGNLLKTYKIGDVVDTSEVKTGIIEERLYCPACGNSQQKVFITIWHSLITGVYLDPMDAEAKVLSIDRADILNHLIVHQSAYDELLRRYINLYHTIEGYREFIVSSADKNKEWDPGIRFLSTRISEFIKEDDPLEAILDSFKPLRSEEYEGEMSDE